MPKLTALARLLLKQQGVKNRGRAIEVSAVVETEMRPALEGDLKKLWCVCALWLEIEILLIDRALLLLFILLTLLSHSDLELVVEKHVFKVHHAVVWARCKWLQALLAERWKAGGQKERV